MTELCSASIINAIVHLIWHESDYDGKKVVDIAHRKNISPATLRKDLSIATGTMTKLRRNEEVAMSVLLRICEYLGSNLKE